METKCDKLVSTAINVTLETKYRDIADGNGRKAELILCELALETKYRDIADGNFLTHLLHFCQGFRWKPSTAI